jgi:hypothetical protein
LDIGANCTTLTLDFKLDRAVSKGSLSIGDFLEVLLKGEWEKPSKLMV